ncbi:MAG: dockerin type I repeat-containing protein, partial [Oscillospiraceae bacterium]|nr:dockerin type I repeat-containing protein [Oscillospiraceae bacterium]
GKNLEIGGSLTATGGTMTDMYWASVYAAGNMTVGGDVQVENEVPYDIGILCYGTLTVGSGRWEAEGNDYAIWAQNGIVLPETHGVTTPENGGIGAAVFHGNSYYDGYSVLNENGRVATHAVIEKIQNIKGDVSGDGIVDNRDLILIARYLVHLVEFNDVQLAAADWNGDGKINNSDLVQIARYVVSVQP